MKHAVLPQCLAILASLAVLHHATRAETVSFTVDPQQSSITLSGSILGNAIKEQGAGSMVTKLGGVLKVDLTTSTIQFVSGSLLDAVTNGLWEPLPGGGDGKAPADFAASASILFATARASLRNVQLEVSSLVLPVTSGQFDSATLIFKFPESSPGTFDYRVSGFLGTSGSEPLAGYSTNRITSGGAIVDSAGSRKLLIPIDATALFSLTSDNDTSLTLKGQLVGVETVSDSFTVQAAVTGGQIVLTWPSQAGKSFRVESSSDLKTWQAAADPITATGASTTWSAPATGGLKLYRVVRLN